MGGLLLAFRASTPPILRDSNFQSSDFAVSLSRGSPGFYYTALQHLFNSVEHTALQHGGGVRLHHHFFN